MKITFNRNVKHDGVTYLQGQTYEFEGELTPELQALLDTTHTDVFTQKREGEEAYTEEVKVAEVAPGHVEAAPKPAPDVRTAKIGANPMMPPAPNINS
jgi:hypothetical protein